MNRRLTLGITSLTLLFTGAALLSRPLDQGVETFAAACIRVSLATGAVWLAYPDLRRVPAWLFAMVVVAVIAIAARPKLAPAVIPLLLLVWLLRPKAKSILAAIRSTPPSSRATEDE